MLHTLYRFRFLLLTAVIAVCFALWPFVQYAVKVDNSLTIWFSDDDPGLVEYRSFHDKFGNDELVILVVKDDSTVLSPTYFKSFIALSRAIEKMPEVQMVAGAGNADVVSKDLFGIMSKPLLTDSSEMEDVKADLDAMPWLREQLFNKDYTACRFIISFKKDKNFDAQRGEILKRVKKVVHEYIPANKTYFGGIGVIYEGLNELSNQDFGFFLGVGYLLMFIMLLLIYRNGWVLLYALGTIAFSTFITVGLYGLFGHQLNLMTILIPTILIVLGLMDIMHIVNEYNAFREVGAKRKERVLAAMKNVFRPCLFTTLTTMAGFLSLLVSPIAILQQFGLFAAIGIFLCLLFTYLFGLIILPLTSPSNKVLQPVTAGVNRLLLSVHKNIGGYAAIAVALIAISMVGILFLKSDTYTLGYFPKNHRIVKDHKQMEATWGPYMPLELVIRPAGERTLYDTAIIKRAIAFEDSIRTLTGVGGVFGFHSFYTAAITAQYGRQANAMYRSSSALSVVHKQLPHFYPSLYSAFIHEPSQTGRISVFGTMATAKELTLKTDTLLRMSKTVFGNTATISPSGYQPMYSGIVSYVTKSQVYSLIITGVAVFVLLWIFIGNAKLSLLASLTNLVPITVMLGAMGLAGILLDTATASIAAIMLSVCIDDTVHYIYHYHKLRKLQYEALEAQRQANNHVGATILLTSVVLIAGHAVMIAGSLQTVHLFGLLTVIALSAALFAELIIFPLVLARFDKGINQNRMMVEK